MKQYRIIKVHYCNECPHWNSNEVWCNKEDKGTLMNCESSKYDIPDWCRLRKVTVVEKGEAVMSDDKGNVTKMEF